jgi:fructose-1,6-bisphosphatase/inositol monophosphatase family enzyme
MPVNHITFKLLIKATSHGYLHPSDKSWDMATARLIVQEAGRKVFHINGSLWSVDRNGIIAVSSAITDIMEMIL